MPIHTPPGLGLFRGYSHRGIQLVLFINNNRVLRYSRYGRVVVGIVSIDSIFILDSNIFSRILMLFNLNTVRF